LWFEDLVGLIAKHNLDDFAPSWFASAHDRYVTGKDILEGDPRGVIKKVQELRQAMKLNGKEVSTDDELDAIIDNAMRQAEENDAKKK
jgi:hypothetical protein